MASTGLASVGLGASPDNPMPSGPSATFNDWVDWAMIRLGLRKPRPLMTLGRISMPRIGTPGVPLMGEPAAVPPAPAPPAPVIVPECGEEP